MRNSTSTRRDAAFAEARELIRDEFGLGDDRMATIEADRILADLKRRLLKKMTEEELDLASERVFVGDGRPPMPKKRPSPRSNSPCRKSGSAFENCWSSSRQQSETKVEKLISRPGHLVAAGPQRAGRHLRHLPGQRRDARARRSSRRIPARAWSCSRAATTAASSRPRSGSSKPTARR